MLPENSRLERPHEEAKAGNEESDPLVDTFLGFIANDIASSPHRVKALPKSIVVRSSKLVQNVAVSDDDVIPENVTF